MSQLSMGTVTGECKLNILNQYPNSNIECKAGMMVWLCNYISIRNLNDRSKDE